METGLQNETTPLAKKLAIEKILNVLGIDEWVTYNSVVQNAMFVLFLVGIALFHITNTHMAESMIRHINTLERDIKELRWEYMTIKSDLMLNSKQSELAKKLEPFGIKELTTPPKKIVIEKDRY